MTRLLLILAIASSVGAQTSNQDKLTFTNDVSTIAPISQPWIIIGGDTILTINTKDGKPLIKVNLDKTVIYGDTYKPDDAAKLFWKTIGDDYPSVCDDYKSNKEKSK